MNLKANDPERRRSTQYPALQLAQISHSLWLKTTTLLLRGQERQIKSAHKPTAAWPMKCIYILPKFI
jgi:hypothetical protein